ncbi:hypothetical protein TNCV_2778771 [Trichonephila clavipes]|nr:hypothetical protein TNCV_2778771 [Trichonephila clavipes]
MARVYLKILGGCAKCPPGVFLSGEQEIGLQNSSEIAGYFWTIVLPSTSEPELARADAPKEGTRCISGCGMKIWIWISETRLIFLDIAGMRSNDFAFKSRIRIFNPYCY